VRDISQLLVHLPLLNSSELRSEPSETSRRCSVSKEKSSKAIFKKRGLTQDWECIVVFVEGVWRRPKQREGKGVANIVSTNSPR